MSQENVEVVRRSFNAWNQGDVDAIRRNYAEDAVVQTGVTELGRTFEGDDPIGRWAAEMRETWSEVHWEIERIFEADDLVVSFYRAMGKGRESGVEVVRELTGVYRIRDGKIASERIYLDREEALEAAGLRG
jgi:ketosteroid isomerase-like protein